jgi:HD-like signal output (HDOD) protein
MPTLTESAPELSTIELIVRRAGVLYSLPAVAVEVLRLTENPKADVRALRECLQQDPAITAKVLRVVNSSLFGLSHSVGDLNEAVSLLGIKQLKLLVLGFSLPEKLFVDIAREQLDWYWSTTLTRAVAAREVSEQLFKRAGDEAFLAGMMQDLGVLVLLRELGAPYAGLISESIHRHADLTNLEATALGFNHIQLTAGLLNRWRMPETLVRAIAEPRNEKRLARSKDEHGPLARTLHLAELLAQLVGQHRLTVLPDLLEAGRLYCDLTKPRLNDLVASLEPKVRQLASVLSLELPSSLHYVQVLLQAHQAMARVSETVASPVDPFAERATVLASDPRKTRPSSTAIDMSEVQAAMARFIGSHATPSVEAVVAMSGNGSAPTDAARSVREVWSREELPAAAPGAPTSRGPSASRGHNELAEFDVRLTYALGECRSRRIPLSVVVVGINPLEPLDAEQARTIERVISAACTAATKNGEPYVAPAEARRAIVLAGRDRQEAIVVGRGIVERMLQLIVPLSRAKQLAACVPAAGVASIAEPPKNFESRKLFETAERCLAAALTSGGVKSLEVI